jgi:hypothetical protein
MLLLFSIAGAAALAVVAYNRLRSRSPEAASAATRAVRELAAVVLICTKAVESVADTLAPTVRTRMAGDGLYSGYGRPLVDAWDEEEQ